MPLLPSPVILPSLISECLPHWYDELAAISRHTVPSGCSPGSDGVIVCDPLGMLATTNAQLNSPVTLDEYTLARMLASEYGSGSPVEKVAMAWAAKNRAKSVGMSVSNMLLFTPNNPTVNGHYNDQRYGNWAGTHIDPTILDLSIARSVLQGYLNELRTSASFVDPSAVAALKETTGIANWLQDRLGREVWIGTVAGIDAHQLFVTRPILPGEDPASLNTDYQAAAAADQPDKNITACRLSPQTFIKGIAATGIGTAIGIAAAVLL